jgi:uncharacterized protein
MERYLKTAISDDLTKKMVLLTGPRQVGKTTLAQAIGQAATQPLYLNFDKPSDRQLIVKSNWLPSHDYVVLDELHKMKSWKTYLKGVFDTKPKSQRLLVTGSARLDTFRQAGESLAGRYHRWHLHPVSVKELSSVVATPARALEALLQFGGFPEPLFAATMRTRNRWQAQYFSDLVREDILEFSRIQELSAMRILLELLRDRTASPISYDSLARDLLIAPATVKTYLQLLEALHIIFLVHPHHKNIARALSKSPKVYFHDWAYVDTRRKSGELSGAVFENLVACHLQKHVNYLNDSEGTAHELHYLKTRSGKEIDFVLTDQKANVSHFIECKLSDTQVSYALNETLTTHPTAERVQLVHNLDHGRIVDGVQIVPASDWLSKLAA